MTATISAPRTGTPVLEARGLYAGYGDLAAVRHLDMHVNAGEIVALLGPNGAGKTTTLQTLGGSLKPLQGEVIWDGEPTVAPLHKRVRKGLGYIPEERSVIGGLSVRENLSLGRGPISEALRLFPQLEPLLRRQAGLLSGGEQQMLTLARCLASKPRVMLVDELALGLAPIVVSSLLASLRAAALDTGAAVILVEQQVRRALSVADRWYLLQSGSVVASGDSEGTSVEELSAAYL